MDHICAEDSDFTGCAFVGCSLRGARMAHCNLKEVHFKDTVLDNADMQDCCVEAIEVAQEVLDRADTRGISYDEGAWIAEADVYQEIEM